MLELIIDVVVQMKVYMAFLHPWSPLEGTILLSTFYFHVFYTPNPDSYRDLEGTVPSVNSYLFLV